jgi:hypothetical protein
VIVLLALLAAAPRPHKVKPVKPVELHRTQTERAGSPPFDLVPSEVRLREIKNCRVEETLPMGAGTAEKRSCGGTLDAESVRRRCKDAARNDMLPVDVTKESCPADYQRGKFLFPGELKEVIVARRRDGKTVAAFQVLEGDLLATFQHVGDAVLVGITSGERVAFAVVSSHGILKAPPLGDEAVDVEVAHGRIRVTGKAHAMQVYLVPQNGELHVEK